MRSISVLVWCAAASCAWVACQVDDRDLVPVPADSEAIGPSSPSSPSSASSTSSETTSASSVTNDGSGGSSGGASATTASAGSASVTSAGNSNQANSTGGSATGNSAGGGSGGSDTNATTAEATTKGGTAGGATTSTTGGETCAMTEPATSPVAIVPVDGYVACDTNPIGVEGYFYTYHDDLGSSIDPADFGQAGSEICVSGEVAQAPGGDDWPFVGVGFSLHQDSGNEPGVWNATDAGVAGFSFRVSALPEGTPLNFILKGTDLEACAVISSEGTHEVRIGDTLSECWDETGDSPDPATLVALQWAVNADETSAHAFDFCISDIHAIP